MTSRRTQTLNPEQLKSLTKTNNAPALRHISLQFLFLTTLATLFFNTPNQFWLQIPIGLAYSILLIFTFCPLHESIHNTAFASPTLNKITAFICGLILLLPPKHFRAFHLAHHRYTQDPNKDPELATPKPTNLKQYLVHISGLPYAKAQITGLFKHALGKTEIFIPNNQKQSIINEARLFLSIYAVILIWSIFNQSPLFLWLWLLPITLGQPLLRLFLLAEHTGCPEVPNMLKNTRTTKTNKLMQWLCWNMNYHAEHHAYAAIPFFNLPKAHPLLASNIEHLDKSYTQINLKILKFVSHQPRP